MSSASSACWRHHPFQLCLRLLKTWLQILKIYGKGDHAYHANLPTDSLARPAGVMMETCTYGFAKVKVEHPDENRPVDLGLRREAGIGGVRDNHKRS